MEKFLIWLYNKYDFHLKDVSIIKDDKSLCMTLHGRIINLYKQMLIGYMLEYIRDHKYWKESKEQPFSIGEMEFRATVWSKDQYKSFEKIIKLIDGNNI